MYNVYGHDSFIMNNKKINLIIKNMELLLESLKLEMEEAEESNIIKFEDLLSKTAPGVLTDYEPDYYEER
jgi:hypothetical protein